MKVGPTLVLAAALVAIGLALSGCSPKPIETLDDRRGDVNGRSFEVVSLVDQLEWNIRVRGNSMWVARARGSRNEELGIFRLDERQEKRLWRLIAAAQLDGSEDVGALDDPQGTVVFRIRNPGKDSHRVRFGRSAIAEDPSVQKLLTYMGSLIRIHARRRATL